MSFSKPDSHGKKRARAIAFYLPQFYPIPENDEWWGKGFTEWTNVAKARPLFKGHHQPNLPADLGFYDLRVPEVREAQAELARSHGIEGFCYWHYWFGNGKKLLDRPLIEVLSSGKPDFPICLAWANHTWSGVWHGAPDRVLIEQQYPGKDDWHQHFLSVLPAFQDRRYIKVNGKPIFVIYQPAQLKDLKHFVDYWQQLAYDNGLNGIYFVGITSGPLQKESTGLDGVTSHPPGDLIGGISPSTSFVSQALRRLLEKHCPEMPYRHNGRPRIFDYELATKTEGYENLLPNCKGLQIFPCVIPNWDNTPRSGANGIVFINATPELFGRNIDKAINFVSTYEEEEQIIFIKSCRS